MKSIAGGSDFSKQWSKSHREKYDPKNLLEHSEKGRWVTPNNMGGFVIFDLGCAEDFNIVQVALSCCRMAKHITVSVSDSPDGEWTEVLSETLKDYRKQKAPLPLLSIPLEEMVNSQFVKMECTEWYGHSCGLQYFNLMKSGNFVNSDYLIKYKSK